MEARPPVRFRKLRIAWSVGCAMLCVLLVVLWVGSYWWKQSLMYMSPQHFRTVWSYRGGLGFSKMAKTILSPDKEPSWRFKQERITPRTRSTILEQLRRGTSMKGTTSYWGFERSNRTIVNVYAIGFPHWYPVLLSAVLAIFAAPTIRFAPWRFSLRTLLIVTTLVAVILGIVAISN